MPSAPCWPAHQPRADPHRRGQGVCQRRVLRDRRRRGAVGHCAEEDGSLLLQREIGSDGKSTCRVNGRPVTVGQLKALGSRLLNIHGQHDGQQLLDEEQHLVFLDSFGNLETLISAYTEKYNTFTDIQRKIQSLEMDESEKPAGWTP